MGVPSRVRHIIFGFQLYVYGQIKDIIRPARLSKPKINIAPPLLQETGMALPRSFPKSISGKRWWTSCEAVSRFIPTVTKPSTWMTWSECVNLQV